jgi:hypothetical protein
VVNGLSKSRRFGAIWFGALEKLGGGHLEVIMMFELQAGRLVKYFFKSANGCKRLQINAIACRICREN